MIQDYEMHVPATQAGRKKERGTKFDVLLTSYENLRADVRFLQVRAL